MKRLLLILAVCLALMPLLKSTAWGRPVSDIGPIVTRDHDLSVDLWTDRMQDEVYGIGDRMDVYFRANSDCYVTIYSIGTEGNVNLLFPQYPDDGWVYGGVTYRLPDYYDAMDMRLRGPDGVGYIQAVGSRHPGAFRFAVHRGRYRLGIDPIAGDPFIAINAINRRLITSQYIHATATVSFFVGSRVWYPRYMCYDCHGRTVRFDPYRDACPRYSVRVTHNYDYWWGYHYHPAVAHFLYVGPFWRFEIRTIPVYRHRKIRHIDCAYGYGNYYPVRAITRRPQQVVYRPSHTRTVYTRGYRPVTYRDTRTRRGSVSRGSTTTSRSRSIVSPGSTSTRSSDASGSRGSTTTSRSRSTVSPGSTSTRSSDASGSRGSTTTSRSRSTVSPGSTSTRSSDASGSRGSTTTSRSRSTVSPGSTSTRSSGASVSRGSTTTSRSRSTVSPGSTGTRSSGASVSRGSTSTTRSRSSTSRGSTRMTSSSSSSPTRSRSITPSSSSSSTPRSTTRSMSSSSRRGNSTSMDRSGNDDGRSRTRSR